MSRWPRIRHFEFNDHPQVPVALRDLVIEALGRTLRWGRMLEGAVPIVEEFVRGAGTRELLDLGSGSGEHAVTLLGALEARGVEGLKVTLSDLHPRSAMWERLAQEHDALGFVDEPVDASRVDPELSEGRARVIVNTLHHLPEDLVGVVLEDAARSRAPLLVLEGFVRDPLQFLNFAPWGVPALLVTPALTRSRRLQKALLAWTSPIALLVSVHDGLTSALRVYSEEELFAMAPEVEGYRWSYRTYPFGVAGTAYAFWGVPV